MTTKSPWFAKVPPLMAVSIVPVARDRPPLWLLIIALAVGVSPLAGLVLWSWSAHTDPAPLFKPACIQAAL